MKIHLMHKAIDPDAMPVLYGEAFTPESFERDFEVRDGAWRVEDGWLIGESRRNFASMAIMRQSFFGPVCLDFRARVLPPCTHDINCMWSGSWNEQTNTRALAYVAGIGGWWDGKVGFEKSPEYRLNCGTKLLDFDPNAVYHMQCGSIGGHVFVFVNGQLAIEATDPEPIDQQKYGRVGFEAYCTRVAITDFKVRRAVWEPIEERYEPEF